MRETVIRRTEQVVNLLTRRPALTMAACSSVIALSQGRYVNAVGYPIALSGIDAAINNQVLHRWVGRRLDRMAAVKPSENLTEPTVVFDRQLNG